MRILGRRSRTLANSQREAVEKLIRTETTYHPMRRGDSIIMALLREKPRSKHTVIPVHGEFGRYTVNSLSAAKKGQDENYVVDVLASEETAVGTVTGVCPCKGWQVRKDCSHLKDAREKHEEIVAYKKAESLGFQKLD